jgi:pimeloyl-ACP methyl ester carboxylesterase
MARTISVSTATPPAASSATPAAAAGVERYRKAERALWDHYGLAPRERFIRLGGLESPAVCVRVQEVGSGEPVLFVHGTVGPGAWPSLVRELPGFRCIMLERPGWGLSAALDYSKGEYKTVVANVLRETLDALGLDRVHVIGGSIGNLWALRLAAQHPSRVGRIVLLGGGPLTPEVPVPGVIRLLASPIGALMVRLPDTPGRVRSILRKSGHGASLDAGRIPDVFVDWRVALGRYTGSMRHERGMVRAIVSGGTYRPGLTFEDAELAGIEQPTLHVFGTADHVGSVDTSRRMVGLLTQGELRVVDGAGHMPWLDDPGRVAADIIRFLLTEAPRSTA